MNECFGIPGFTPTIADKLRLARSFHDAKKFPEAVALFRGCIGEIPEDYTGRNMLFFDFALCLMDGDLFDDALDAIEETKEKEGDGEIDYPKILKEQALFRLVVMCAEEHKWLMTYGTRSPSIFGTRSAR